MEATVKLSDRDAVNAIVKEYASVNGVEYSEAWIQLYDTMKWRLGENFAWKAHWENMKPLDYIEKRGLLPYLRSLAEQIYGGVHESAEKIAP